MALRSALTFAAVGAFIAEAAFWAILLPLAHYQYTTGIAVSAGIWKPVLLLALAGGSIGLAIFAVRRAIVVRRSIGGS